MHYICKIVRTETKTEYHGSLQGADPAAWALCSPPPTPTSVFFPPLTAVEGSRLNKQPAANGALLCQEGKKRVSNVDCCIYSTSNATWPNYPFFLFACMHQFITHEDLLITCRDTFLPIFWKDRRVLINMWVNSFTLSLQCQSVPRLKFACRDDFTIEHWVHLN